ncbi:MAG: hypothetical protein CMF62_10765 [Magnetococcales bacterium]|nr:hypothetical protein [Magnetococcales bacterium]
MVSTNAMAQTKSAKGINAASSSIGAVVPELGNLESEILESITLMEDMEECGQESRFYDPVADACRTTDPIGVSFSQDADDTTVAIQRPDGSSVNYSLDGEDGVATIVEGEGDTDPDTPPVTDQDDPDEDDPEVTPPRERERWVCRRSGTTWEQGGNAHLPGRLGGAYYLCCEGMPESTAGPVAGLIARQWPGIREHCP